MPILCENHTPSPPSVKDFCSFLRPAAWSIFGWIFPYFVGVIHFLFSVSFSSLSTFLSSLFPIFFPRG
jgi:hypothetical protein